ncbi:MAG: putative bifunctional diguanylate cyclase/phosphodiesterase [Armatimonadota bacterium]
MAFIPEETSRTDARRAMKGTITPCILPLTEPETVLDGELRYQELVEHSPDAVFILCDERCVFINAAGVELFGVTHADDLLGTKLLDTLYSDDREQLLRKIRGIDGEVMVPRCEQKFVRADGTLVDVEFAVSTFTFQGRPSMQIVAHDITERKQAEANLHYLAYYDTLTGLPNRILFHERLSEMLACAGRKRQCLAVMKLDIDLFGETNTLFGHAFGDRLLQEIASRMQEAIGQHDMVSRVGSDEFLFLFPDVSDDTQAQGIAKRLMDRIGELIDIDGDKLHITASIGVTRYPDDGTSAEDLIRNADLAVHRAKTTGNITITFLKEMHDAITQKRTIGEHLRRALENQNELQAFYQPQFRIDNMQLVATEALARWFHPEWGLVSPGQFIPVAEETGLIETLDDWILQTACMQTRAWQLAGVPDLRIASNLSARQFRRHDLVDTVQRILNETGLPADSLELEITESTTMENVDRTLTILRSLADIGVRLAIDDFGTGYSSLSYLKRFPVHTLKIDRVFVKDVLQDNDSAVIVKAIIALAHSLSLKVLAEGVEENGQLEFLRSLGCDEVQGFLLSKPLPAATFMQDFLTKMLPTEIPTHRMAPVCS